MDTSYEKIALRYAQDEAGLCRTAFSSADDHALPAAGATAACAGAAGVGLTPFQLLAAALDDVVSAKVLPPVRRANAEFLPGQRCTALPCS